MELWSDWKLKMPFREIVKDVFNVGCLDPILREFHVHEIGRGTSYNSFLLKGKKITIVDTVKACFADQFIQNIKECLSGSSSTNLPDSLLEKIDIIYVLHTEPDHNGSLRRLYSLCPNATIVCGRCVKQNLARWFPESVNWRIQQVANLESISVGDETLQLLETPMLHWNDSTFAYMKEKKLIFTSDSFGQHIGNNLTTDAEMDKNDLLVQMKVYYAQVFSQFERPTLKMVAETELLTTGKNSAITAGEEWKADFDASGIDVVLPAHGVCLLDKETIVRSFRLYRRWASQISTPTVIIISESIYDTTSKMGDVIAETIQQLSAEHARKMSPLGQTPVKVEVMCARRNTVLDVVAEVMDAPVVIFGTATFNNDIMPNLAKLLHVIGTYKWKPKAVGCFGSYGWSPAALQCLGKRAVEGLKWNKIGETVMAVHASDDKTTAALQELGKIAFETALEKGQGNALSLP
ncbi:putative Anaerobic nitric oxide reductase flavorubredoxin [Blattamonas nauphoetae]|uniref:Anaerobic nitric oxide reductase flavorubredoxin n=1 Tax=Blattamonas nauphoetae TaxID=2049346 RepID=A0ABQ9XKW2_9EUKA|nr:putative Anaerobic nitric oxide reductase flavorubredoxin [Blattamonas nauphoetae]